ncbi:DUF1992 domain-containing protein [Virgibacillus halodenitrificans]|nr:DUF1992 domain-containing protein [Virgibacillus halodenitrificans]
MDKKYNDLIGDILDAAGEKDNYSGPGKGKPIPKANTKYDLFQNFQRVAKENGYLPPWLKLQKEITRLIHTAATDQDIKEINKKISAYNQLCPSPLQKSPVHPDRLDKAKKTWNM